MMTKDEVYLTLLKFEQKDYKLGGVSIPRENYAAIANEIVKSFSNKQKVLICNNCKDIWIAPKDRCDCGSTTLTETRPSNYKFAQNYA